MSAGRLASRSDARPLDPPLGPDDHVTGPADAALELVMYGDVQCPYCVAAQSILRRVRERFDGRLRFAFRHMPLPAHPDAANAAQASDAAAAQGGFWAMHDALFAARGRLSLARDERSARAAGITGTPAFFANGVLHEASFDAGSLVAALRAQ